MPARTKLAPDLIERVLAKLGLSNQPSVDLSGLQMLYAAWCQKVPFDNIRKLIHVSSNDPGTLPGDSATDYFEAWLNYGTGGTCWAGNGALQSLLSSLGFIASRGVATMLVVPECPPNHGTVVVELDGSQYLVDASILHKSPLRLDKQDSSMSEFPSWLGHVYQKDAKWHINWRPLQRLEGLDCRIDHVPAAPEEFSQRHENTRLWSPFNYELHIRSVRGNSVLGIAQGKQTEIHPNGDTSSREISQNERLDLLINKLFIKEEIAAKLPADRPTPPPPDSLKGPHRETV